MASNLDIDRLIQGLPLLYHTPSVWVELVERDFHLFLADHASNERKAAASAMNFVVQYPNRISLVKTAAKVAEEEILHFRQVFQKMVEIGAPLRPDEKDPYTKGLLSHVRSAGDDRLLDRLLVSSIIETRGVERFALLVKHHSQEEWKSFYRDLMKAEIQHGSVFLHEARKIFPKTIVEERFVELLRVEADLVRNLELTYRFH